MDDRIIRVLVADTQSLSRLGIRSALDEQKGFQVVADVSDAAGAMAEAERTRPDVALLDAELPVPGVFRATERIRGRIPTCSVLVIAADPDEDLLLSAVVAGARGFLTKDRPLEELLEAVRGLARGEVPIPPNLLGGLVDGLVRRRQQQGDALRRISTLTRREREVLAILARGPGDNEAIARALMISPDTARTHVQNVLSKLEVHSRLEAAALARQSDVLDEPAVTR
jgi:DNA-binding NarL/FixJ family response regulator